MDMRAGHAAQIRSGAARRALPSPHGIFFANADGGGNGRRMRNFVFLSRNGSVVWVLMDPIESKYIGKIDILVLQFYFKN